MYTLYYSQGACSVATQVVLRELNQAVNLIDAKRVENFKTINPTGAVPVLVDGDNTMREGAAIMLYLLDKHRSQLLPTSGSERQKAIQDIMFANATMHPAYGRLFFLAENVSDEEAKNNAFNASAAAINDLWKVVENELVSKSFLGGNSPSAADIMLTVYSTWGAYFPVDIAFGEKTTAMINAVKAMPNFQKTVEAEQLESAKSVEG